MEIEFDGQPEKDAFFKAVRSIYRPARYVYIWRIGLAIFLASVTIGLLINGLLEYENLTQREMVRLGSRALVLPVLLWILLRPFFAAQGAARKLWKNPRTRIRQWGSVTTHGITFRDGVGVAQVAWTEFAKVYRADDMVALLTDAQEVTVFPRSFFKSSGDWAQFAAVGGRLCYGGEVTEAVHFNFDIPELLFYNHPCYPIALTSNSAQGGTMPSTLNPYLGFHDNARQAMEFYKSVFGGTLTMSTFKDFHASQSPSEDNLIMHGELRTENGITLMGSDTPAHMEYNPGSNMSVSLSGEDEAELRGYWDKLAVGSEITMPLEKAMWGDTFGMLTDKFGTQWLVNIAGTKA